MKEKILPPVKEKPEYYDAIEANLIEFFRKEIYLPLMKELGLNKKTLQNSLEDLHEAIMSGRITFYRGHFRGRFSAAVSKELKRLGAQWDRKQGSWKIPQTSLPMEIVQSISASESQMTQKISAIDKKLAAIVPEQLTEKLQLGKLFDQTLWKVEKDFQKNVKNIIVTPTLTRDQTKRLADEWANNMDKYVKDFTEKEIKQLRKMIQENVLEGNRPEQIQKTIQRSFGVSQNKAKFLARQETSLMMAKFKETRYVDAGSEEYIWKCVHMPKDKTPAQHNVGNVRYYHGILDGTRQRWDRPPITTKDGKRNHPGEDFNCRCFPMPIVKFK